MKVNVRKWDQAIEAAQGAALVEVYEALRGELVAAGGEGDLGRLSEVLRLVGVCAAKLGRGEEAQRLLLQGLRGFALLGDEVGYLGALEELVRVLGEGAQPYTHKLDFAEDVRRRLKVLLGQWVDVTRPAQAEGGEGRAGQLYVGDGEMRAFLAGGVGEGLRVGLQVEVERAPEVVMAGLMARLWAGLKAGQRLLPVQVMMARLGLKTLDVWALLTLHVGQTDPYFKRAYTYAWNDFSQKTPDVTFLSGLLLGGPKPIWSLMAEVVGPGGLLGRYDLIQSRRLDGGGELVQLSAAGARLMDGVRGLSGDVSAWCQLVETDSRLLSAEEGSAELDRLLSAWVQMEGVAGSARLRIVMRGSTDGERKRVAAIACAKAGLGLIRADMGALRYRPFGEVMAAMSALAREAGLSDRVVVLDLPSPPRDEQQQQSMIASMQAALTQGLPYFASPVLLSLSVDADSYLPTLPGAIEVEVPLLPMDRQVEVWGQTLARYGLVVPPEDQLRRVIQRFPLGADAIEEATREIWLKATLLNEQPSPDALISAAGRKVRHSMGSIAQRITMTLDWADVVLPDETTEQLKEIAAFARFRGFVMDDWGFRHKLPYGRALSALFWGPPGTGKTMMAGIIARELGMELFRIDLSQVVSKYIGETEKNLGRAFDEATRNNAVLLFDEADSLFSKRTEVKSSNDRYANLEVNFLLQRMESFEGVTILTTNAEKSIDDAFKRRIRFKVEFPFPDEKQRGDLWKIMIPKAAQVERGIQYEHLGQDFEMSGGSIKNAVLRAAFIAAARGKRIGFDELWLAGSREYSELGHLTRKGNNDDL